MPGEAANTRDYILFEINGATYGIASRNVLHLEMVEKVTPVPDTLPFVDGVVFSRGEVIPAINLRARFGFEKIPYALKTRLIVSRLVERVVGFIVDSAREFASIPDDAILPPPPDISGLSTQYLTGFARIGERMVLILDLEQVLRPGKANGLLPRAGNAPDASDS